MFEGNWLLSLCLIFFLNELDGKFVGHGMVQRAAFVFGFVHYDSSVSVSLTVLHRSSASEMDTYLVKSMVISSRRLWDSNFIMDPSLCLLCVTSSLLWYTPALMIAHALSDSVCDGAPLERF